jgi:hypothetical protein
MQKKIEENEMIRQWLLFIFMFQKEKQYAAYTSHKTTSSYHSSGAMEFYELP